MINTIQKCTIRIVFLISILFVVFHIFMSRCIQNVQISIYKHNYSNSSVRIYCFILTTPKYFATRARAVNLTWAPRCDQYTFISEYANDTKGLPIAPIANLSSGSKHLTQKTTLALYYIHENFLKDYEWIVKADDDTYIFVDNLKLFLQEQNSSQAITFGYNLLNIVDKGYQSGGAGYVLSREAVKRFYRAHHKSNPSCSKDGGDEDREIGKCLRRNGVYLGKSVDKYNRERFHPGPFAQHYLGPTPDWLQKHAENTPVIGSNCCSSTTISFHYVSPENQFLIDKMYYGFHNHNL